MTTFKTYKSRLIHKARVWNHSAWFSLKTLQSPKQGEFVRLFTFINTCQDIVYNYYAPNYEVNTRLVEEMCIYKNVKALLDRKITRDYFPSHVDMSKLGEFYDDVFELYMLMDSMLFISSHSFTRFKPLTVITERGITSAGLSVCDAIHDGWSYKTYFVPEKYAQGKMVFNSIILQNKKRLAQFKESSELHHDVQLQDLASYMAIIYALNNAARVIGTKRIVSQVYDHLYFTMLYVLATFKKN